MASSIEFINVEAERQLTGRGDYIQPLIQSINLRNKLAALRFNELLGGALMA